MATYEQTLQRLYQAPVANFLAERKRLAAELRAQGDEAGAAQIAKRPKPITSVWAVNQLYWHARDAFDELLAAASRLREGDLRATKNYHDAIANLRRRAAVMLKDAGYAVSDTTLRRAATTLAAIAAAGGFEPDPPGALAADRDPPGFETVSILAKPIKDGQHTPPTPDRPGPTRRPHDEHAGQVSGDRAARERERLRARLHAAEEVERKQQEAERARRKAEQSRVQMALRAATTEVSTRERALAALETQLRAAEKAVGDARQMMKDLECKLAELDEEED